MGCPRDILLASKQELCDPKFCPSIRTACPFQNWGRGSSPSPHPGFF